FSVSGIRSRVVAGSGGVVGVRAIYAVCGRQHLSKASIPVGFALLARAWRERRAENHGDHRGPFVSTRILPRQLSCPFLGCDLLSGGYGSRHPSRRLADCPKHGIKDYSAESHARVLRGIRRRRPFLLRRGGGVPVSTTHTITGSIVGVGAARRT